MKLTIVVTRNRENRNTLLHPPIVQLNDGMPQSRGCSTHDLLNYLNSGVSKEEIYRARGEIEVKGWSILESNKIIDADLERVLEPKEDLGRVLLCEGR